MPAEPDEPLVERRTRIICHFPLNRQPETRKTNQLRVIRRFMKHLKKTALKGYSMSSILDTVFTGFWRARPTGEFDEENVVLFMIDHPMDRNDPGLWRFVSQMKSEIQRLYHRYAGEKEREVWIVAHPIDRLV